MFLPSIVFPVLLLPTPVLPTSRSRRPEKESLHTKEYNHAHHYKISSAKIKSTKRKNHHYVVMLLKVVVYYQQRNSRAIRHYLTFQSTNSLVTSLLCIYRNLFVACSLRSVYKSNETGVTIYFNS